jgi:hypothetical protein
MRWVDGKVGVVVGVRLVLEVFSRGCFRVREGVVVEVAQYYSPPPIIPLISPPTEPAHSSVTPGPGPRYHSPPIAF